MKKTSIRVMALSAAASLALLNAGGVIAFAATPASVYTAAASADDGEEKDYVAIYQQIMAEYGYIPEKYEWLLQVPAVRQYLGLPSLNKESSSSTANKAKEEKKEEKKEETSEKKEEAPAKEEADPEPAGGEASGDSSGESSDTQGEDNQGGSDEASGETGSNGENETGDGEDTGDGENTGDGEETGDGENTGDG